MPTTSITVKVPGKLMIAGEFAVLEPHHDLVVMAVNRYVYATLAESSENRLSLTTFDLNNLAWEYESNAVKIKTADSRVRFVEDAMTIVYTYLKENNITLNPFQLSVKSELDDVSGRKYGLGSSAAVVTSVVAAMLKKYLPEAPPSALIFKLAAIAHVKTQGSGSGADVAASSYGGFLQYASFQAGWLQKADADAVTQLVEENWPYLSLNPIQLPENVHMCIGWTGTPASTSKLITKIKQLNIDHPELYEVFLTDSERAVSTFLKGIAGRDASLIIDGIKQNRHALATVGNNANADVETPLLKKLCDLAEEHGGAGKPSGAGGGDCGIAFLPSREKAEQLMQAWEQAGINALDIKANDTGAAVL